MRNLILLIGAALVIGCGSAPVPENSSSPSPAALEQASPKPVSNEATGRAGGGAAKNQEPLSDDAPPAADSKPSAPSQSALPQPTTSATPAHLR